MSIIVEFSMSSSLDQNESGGVVLDFDLDRMGPTEFEHLIQSLSKVELGNGVKIFGAGADGGREASFNGRVRFPAGDSSSGWDGVGVVQAKHRRFPGHPASNADWLLNELRVELEPWKSRRGIPARRSPIDYYLIATNVRLSPVPEVGGIDRVYAALGEHAAELNLKGYFVWHYDEICAMIRNHADIRACFGGLITTGDVLASREAFFPPQSRDTSMHVWTHAAQQLVAKQWVRMSDSGSDDGSKLPLAGVGVDLPSRTPDSRPEDPDHQTIARIIQLGDKVLKTEYRRKRPFAVVVIGGPGQGKSTLTHMVCQAYRAALLESADPSHFAPSVTATLESTTSHLASIGIPTPVQHRWPIYTELAKFADAVAGDPNMSLLRYLAQTVTVDGEKLRASELSNWFSVWPTLIVLDGLDEVPTAQIRDEVVEKVNDFVIEAHSRGHDLFILATTRPQGYHGEFGEIAPQQLVLRDLTPSEGVAYGARVVSQRHREDPDQEAVVRRRLEEAARQPNTARLMKSPLQVTIMSVLFNRLHKAPPTRHGLFDAYYDAVYMREIGKAGYVGQALETYRDDVDFVHEQAALYLHVRAESEGEAEPRLAVDELRRLFEKRLADQEHDPKTAAKLIDKLVKASTERLVLLVASRPDEFSFEIRSLQEYMAARAVTTGPTGPILDRLIHLAPAAHWRNTWLLAATRMFVKHEHARAELFERLRQLDDLSTTNSLIGAGKRLAADLLVDDIAASSPLYKRTLLRMSLELLQGWAGPELPGLASTVATIANDEDDDASYEIYRGAVTAAFESEGKAKISAVLFLKNLERSPGRAGALANRLLSSYQNWRPTAPSTKSETPRVGDKELVAAFSADGLSANEKSARLAILRILEGIAFRTRLSPAESAIVASQEISISTVMNLQPHLQSTLLRDRLAKAALESSVTHAAMAIWLRKALSNLVERQRVGDSPLISPSGQGLFD